MRQNRAYAFRYNKLTNVTLSDGLTSIGVSAFANNELTNIIIPNSIKSLPNYAFKNNQLTSITLSESITYISHGAFLNNKLTSVTLPKSLKTIKNYSFSGNPLTSVIAKGTKPATIMSDSFRYYSERINIALTIPEGTKADYITAEWTGFKSVTESATLGIDDITLKGDDDVALLITNNQLKITTRASHKLKHYTIYSITGANVLNGNKDTFSIEHLHHGIYIAVLILDNSVVISKKFAK